MGYDELVARDKASLDIFWLKDDSLEDSDNLPAPAIIAAEIVEDLRAALVQFEAIGEDLNGRSRLWLGGVVVVPKSSVSTIEEAVHFPPPTVLPTAPAVSRPGAPDARSRDRSSGAVQPCQASPCLQFRSRRYSGSGWGTPPSILASSAS